MIGSSSIQLSVTDSQDTTLIVTIYPENDKPDADWGKRFDCPSSISGTSFYISTTWNTGWVTSGSCRLMSRDYVWHNLGGTIYYNIKNTTNSSVKVVVNSIAVIQYYIISMDKKFYLNIPPKTSCSATVDNLTIGNVVTGSSPTSIHLPFSISGSTGYKSLVFSGADIQSDGKLNLGGSSSGVKVYPASNYISGSTWNAGSISGSIPLTVDASAGKAGTWTSSLLATLTCS
ncbi:hypothetical protein [Citrobacter europaeus]|uniref:hypothetical protein n=1 Tax=Citrobacter europaeus TaxID=1914243 RepID=UPI0039C2F28C